MVIDPFYLPRSRYGYTKGLIFVDSATGFVTAYPCQNLLATTIRRNILWYLCSHPPPEIIKADFGKEFQKDLEGFLSRYGIELHSSMPYAKGSTSAAESAIALTKNALRQLCLSNPTNWPELLPTLLQALNSTQIQGTSASRAQLYFSPYSWQNSLKLSGLLFPERLFLETYDKLNHLIDRRKKNLVKKHILDKTDYYEGNLVFSTNVPTSKTNVSGSAELNSTIEDLYYVEKVFARQLRLIGVFSGTRRVLPREMCTKVSIDKLANLQIRLQNHQLQRLTDHMLKANQYLPPSYTRTWQYLMSKKQNDQSPANPPDYIPNVNISDDDESQEIPEPDNLDPQSDKAMPQSVSDIDNLGIQPDVEIPQDPSSSLNPDDLESSTPIVTPPQAMLRPDASSNLGTPTLDVFGQPDDAPPIIRKQTRSGRAYSSILRQTYHVCPPDLESAKPDSVFCANDPGNQANSGLECPTFHTSTDDSPVGPTLTDSLLIPELKADVIPALVNQNDSLESDLPPTKVVKFSSHRNIRLFSEHKGTFSDFSQVCSKVETSIQSLKPTLYIMSQVCGIDHSLKEVFYKAYYTSPAANTLAIEEEENDFYYDN